MKKIILLLCLAFVVSAPAFSADKKAIPSIQKNSVVKTEAISAPVDVPTVKAQKSSEGLSVKGGLAGGAARLGVSFDKKVKETMMVMEAGYGIGNQYSLMSAGVGIKLPVKESLYAGASVNYSAYSDAVKLSIGGEIKEKAGVGFGVFAGSRIKEDLSIQAGYDTRLGLIAEASYKL